MDAEYAAESQSLKAWAPTELIQSIYMSDNKNNTCTRFGDVHVKITES